MDTYGSPTKKWGRRFWWSTVFQKIGLPFIVKFSQCISIHVNWNVEKLGISKKYCGRLSALLYFLLIGKNQNGDNEGETFLYKVTTKLWKQFNCLGMTGIKAFKLSSFNISLSDCNIFSSNIFNVQGEWFGHATIYINRRQLECLKTGVDYKTFR